MKTILFTLILTLSSFAFAETEPDPTAADRLEMVYDRLYSIDYRKLEIEDFKTYSEVLRELDSIKDEVEKLLTQTPGQNTVSVQVYEETFEYNINWGLNCGDFSDHLETLRNRASENGIRACYTSGAIECSVKIEARMKSLTNKGSTGSGTNMCEAVYDVVIEQTQTN